MYDWIIWNSGEDTKENILEANLNCEIAQKYTEKVV